MKKTLLSFVIPCYRSEKTIEKVVEEIIQVVSERESYDYEIVCVNDCSPDNVYSVLEKLAKENTRLKVVNFIKNMGKHSAVLAGYAVAKGDIIVNLDDDCQCPTYDVWRLIEPLESGEYDISTASYKQKKESFIKRKGSDLNSLMSSILLEKPRELRFENFSAITSLVAKEMTNYKNPYPYLEGLFLRVSKKVAMIPMEERNRGDDNASGFTLSKSISLIINGLTAFSVKPLRIASLCGFMFSAIGFVYGIYIVASKLLNPEIAMGYSSMMAVMLFSFGLIMLMLGLIGEYIGRIYICLNDSPQYVIRNTINLEPDKQ